MSDYQKPLLVLGLSIAFTMFLLAALLLAGCSEPVATTTTTCSYQPQSTLSLPPSIQTQTGSSTPSAVVVSQNRVTLPDGSQLSTTASLTQGIQEAIDYAADYGWDLFVLPGTYTLLTPLHFPSLQGKTIRFEYTILNFGPSVVSPAITFDSTMMVDFNLIGEINAPNASVGILFAPHTIVPLDGIVVQPGMTVDADSRFRVQKIISKGPGVQFDRSAGDMTNNLFYFGDSQIINPCGSRESHFESNQELLASGGLQPLPYDLYNPNIVVINPPTGSLGGLGSVSTPEGILDVSSSGTSGVQEGITYAVAHDENLVIYGRGLQLKYITSEGTYPTTGFYQINQGLTFPPMSNRTIRIWNVTFNYGVVDKAMLIQDAQNVDFELTGQIVAPQANEGVTFKSQSGILNSKFRMGHQAFAKNSNFHLDSTTGPISSSFFIFAEAIGADYNVRVDSDFCFCYNQVVGLHMHGPAKVAGLLKTGPAVLNDNFDLIIDNN